MRELPPSNLQPRSPLASNGFFLAHHWAVAGVAPAGSESTKRALVTRELCGQLWMTMGNIGYIIGYGMDFIRWLIQLTGVGTKKKIKKFWKWIQYDSVMHSRQDTSKIQCWFLLKKDLKHGSLWAAPIFRIRLSPHCHHTWGEDELQPLGPVSCCIIHWSPSSAPWRVEVPPVDCGGLAIHVLPHLSSLVNVGRNGWVVPANRETLSIFVWWHSLIVTMNKRWNGWVLVVRICLECFLFGGNKLSQETNVQSPNIWRGGRWAHLMFFAHIPLWPATDSYRKPTTSVPSSQGAIPDVPSYKPWAIIYHLLSIITITTTIIILIHPHPTSITVGNFILARPNHLLQLYQTYHHCQGPYICGNLWHIGIHGGLCLHDDSKSCVHRSKDIPRLLTWSPGVHGNQPASNLSSKSLLMYESMPPDKVHQNTIFNLDNTSSITLLKSNNPCASAKFVGTIQSSLGVSTCWVPIFPSLVVVALLLQVFYLADCESGGSSAFKAPWAPMALSLNSISARNLSSIRKECWWLSSAHLCMKYIMFRKIPEVLVDVIYLYISSIHLLCDGIRHVQTRLYAKIWTYHVYIYIYISSRII